MLVYCCGVIGQSHSCCNCVKYNNNCIAFYRSSTAAVVADMTDEMFKLVARVAMIVSAMVTIMVILSACEGEEARLGLQWRTNNLFLQTPGIITFS